MDVLKEDIDFLEEILEKVESNNMHDQLEGYQMLRDQISHMRKRHLTSVAADALIPAVRICPYCKRKTFSNPCGHCGERHR